MISIAFSVWSRSKLQNISEEFLRKPSPLIELLSIDFLAEKDWCADNQYKKFDKKHFRILQNAIHSFTEEKMRVLIKTSSNYVLECRPILLITSNYKRAVWLTLILMSPAKPTRSRGHNSRSHFPTLFTSTTRRQGQLAFWTSHVCLVGGQSITLAAGKTERGQGRREREERRERDWKRNYGTFCPAIKFYRW